ncbi:hypothetical protein FHS18_003848 [Paenibacillus phyllosphaerae]|uniref:Transposon Tn7 transposition protein TnsD C-termianl domain-containing protein n=1 Tax=Paenibacillus phyllosphaerae TaxID=274593 RepID=A0A7W5AZQ9_9BACL|nr:hypothetical protein [Paenibacillus phyllosphaerae]
MNEWCALPTPYPDELLYSVTTRYHLRSNNTSAKWTLKEVFGTDNVIPTIDLPSHLGEFAKRCMVQGKSTDHWIEKHTLFPFYAPFLPEARTQRLRKLMKSSDGSGIHALVGITASTLETNRHLHFCPSCFDEDINQYGEPYWHRVHQLSGCLVCPKHRKVLEQITYPLSERHGLTVLPIKRVMFHSVPVITGLPDKVFCRLSDIACDLQSLLHLAEVPVLYDSKPILLPRLAELGYVTAGQRIRQHQLQEQFTCYYGHEILKMLDSLPDRNDWSWLTFATRAARRAIHPLRQLLLFRFLYGSFQEFMSHWGNTYAPFGKGPWPCLNRTVDHYRKSVIKSCSITRCTDTGRPVGTFRCECGFAYSRRGPDRSEEDRLYRGRIKSYGSIWASKLQEYLSQGLSFRKIAALLDVDTNTIIKYSKTEIHDRIEPAIPKKEIKSRLDSRVRTSSKPRVDWEKRDIELSWQVEEVCKGMNSDDASKPIRITRAAIGKRIGRLSLLEKYKRKLPITMSILEQYLESVSQFQIRRVRWAAERLSGEWPIRRWKLIRKAGLRPGYSKEVSEEIDRCLSRNTINYQHASTEVIQTWLH